jgi:hypothetical protein
LVLCSQFVFRFGSQFVVRSSQFAVRRSTFDVRRSSFDVLTFDVPMFAARSGPKSSNRTRNPNPEPNLEHEPGTWNKEV